MTSEERESRLTAYALNDAGVSATERQEIDAILASDPEVEAAYLGSGSPEESATTVTNLAAQ